MNSKSSKCLKRWWRQLVFVPFLHNRWLTTAVKDDFAKCIAHAEQGHQGEICLIIENHLPIGRAYYQNCQMRALDLFGLHRVWDTANNTGVLVYVNLCEKSLHIIADRGIDKHAKDDWQPLYEKTAIAFKNKDFKNAIIMLINDIGNLLRLYYPNDDIHGNEIADDLIYLK